MSDNQNKLSKFWHELKRRKVLGIIIVYATTAFILLQLLSILIESLNLPKWVMPFFIVLLVVGFPIAIIFSWFYDFFSKCIIKTELEVDSKNSLLKEPEKPAPDKSIIVLPFDNMRRNVLDRV